MIEVTLIHNDDGSVYLTLETDGGDDCTLEIDTLKEWLDLAQSVYSQPIPKFVKSVNYRCGSI